jgi:hypothetical protein
MAAADGARMSVQPRAGTNKRLWLTAAVLLAAAVLSRAPLFGYPFVSDETEWSYGGREWALHGESPYQAVFESKPPGIYALFAAMWALGTENVNAARLVSSLAVFATGLGLLWLGVRLRDYRAGLVAALGYVLWAGSPTVGDPAACTEPWVALAATWGMVCALLGSGPWSALMTGICAAGALLFKQTGALEVLAILIALALRGVSGSRETEEGRGAHLGTVALGWGVLGFALAMGMVVAYFARLGDLPGLLEVGYLAVLRGTSGYGDFSRLQALHNWVPFLRDGALLVVGLVALVGWSWREMPRQARLSLGVWLVLALLSPVLTGPRYGHHLVTLMAPMALAGGLGSSWLWRRLASGQTEGAQTRRRGLAWLVLAALVSGYLVAEVPVAKRGVGYLVKGPFTNYGRIVGEYVAQRSRPEDTIFCAGDNYSQAVYLYADRRSPCRHVNLHYQDHASWWPEMRAGLAAHPPRFFVFGGELSLNNPLNRRTPAASYLADYVEKGPYRRVTVPGAERMAVFERTQ